MNEIGGLCVLNDVERKTTCWLIFFLVFSSETDKFITFKRENKPFDHLKRMHVMIHVSLILYLYFFFILYPFPSKSILPLKCTFVSLIHEFWWLYIILMWPHLFVMVLSNKQLKGHIQKWPVMRLASGLKIDKYDSVDIRIWSMSKNDNWIHQINWVK